MIARHPVEPLVVLVAHAALVDVFRVRQRSFNREAVRPTRLLMHPHHDIVESVSELDHLTAATLRAVLGGRPDVFNHVHMKVFAIAKPVHVSSVVEATLDGPCAKPNLRCRHD
jgi:hypothetical protein